MGKKVTSRSSESQTVFLEKAMLSMEDVKSERKDLVDAESRRREIILGFMDKLNITEHIMEKEDDDGKVLKAAVIPVTSVKYDFERLREAVSTKILKKLCNAVVDPAKVEAAYEMGLINMETIIACSTVKKSTRLNVDRVKREE